MDHANSDLGVIMSHLQKIVMLDSLPAIYETAMHMSGLSGCLKMWNDFSISCMKWPLGQNFQSWWHLEQIPNAKYDQLAYPESQLGELGQVWVLVWLTEDKLGWVTVDKNCRFIASHKASWQGCDCNIDNYCWALPTQSYFQRGPCPILSQEEQMAWSG